MAVSYNIVRVTDGTPHVIERCGDGEQGEKRANERRRILCRQFGVDSTEIRIAKEFQDTETILRDIIRFQV